MTLRLLLVFPRSFAVSYGDMRYVSHLTGRAGLLTASLATVAALTPPGWRIRIVDENVEDVPYDEPWDLVGLTGFHVQLGQAELVARRFRERGVPVVAGGPSVSVSPERWEGFCDALFVGEAERTWPAFAERFARGEWAPGPEAERFVEGDRPDLSLTPPPDYSGHARAALEGYFGGIVQTSRGCPFDCEFCDVIVYVGRKMRYKPVDRVIEEVGRLARMGLGFAVLADDNFTAGRKQSKAILRALKEWNHAQRAPMNFVTQLSIDAAGDEELLQLCAEAGLTRVLIGIESPSVAALTEAHKLQNVRSDLLADLRTFHEHGLMVLGTSIVGFDHDDAGTFEQHRAFFQKSGVLSPQPFPLQAPDGTPLKARVQAEGRYNDWTPTLPPELANNFNTFTMTPRQLTTIELRDGILWLMRALWDPEATLERSAIWFEHWASSPKRGRLDIPRMRVDSQASGILWRMARRNLFGSNPEQRAFRGLMALARRSDHPQAFGIAASVFLTLVNVGRMADRLEEASRREADLRAPA